MKHQKILVPIMLAMTLALSIVAGTTKDMAISAESNDIDIEGIVGQYTLEEGDMAAVIYEVNKETGDMIDEEIIKQEEANYEAGTVTDIVSRNWNTYSSSSASLNLTSDEMAFYTRLTNLAQYYMDNSTIDAYYVNSYNIYAINGVKYSDLNLTSTQAFYVAQWFLYNNPQYYFLKPTFLTTSSAIYIACHDVAVDGDDRASLTNDIFDTVDYIVSEVQAATSSQYEAEQCIHDIVCGNLTYQSGTYDQSIYSSIMLGETVCAGYSGMINVLNNAAGINTITSLSKVHAWNEVELDGEWYGLDATWDDSLSNKTFFNVSEDNLKKYDGSSREHTVETSWVNWTPVLADHDYGGASSTGEETSSEVTLDVPELTITPVDGDPTSFRVNWQQIDNASAYEFCVYSNPDYTDCVITQTVKSQQVRLTKMNNGQTYYFTVRALRSVGDEIYYSDYAYGTYTCVLDEPVQDEPVEEPAQITVNVPTDVNIIDATENSFRISWSAVENATSYRLELYRDAEYTDMITTGSTAKTSMKVSGLSAGQSVYIRLCAVLTTEDNVYYSDYIEVVGTSLQPVSDSPANDPSESDAGNQNVPEETPAPVAPVIDVPMNFTATDVTETSIRVIWDAVKNATYEIEIARDAEFADMLAKGTTAKTKMNIKNLSAGTSYYMRVRAASVVDNQTYYSDWNSMVVMTNAEQIIVNAPSNVVVSDVDSDSAKISWNEVPGATYEFIVKKYTRNVDGTYDIVSTGVTSDTYAVIDNLTADTEYFVLVKANLIHNGTTYVSDWSQMALFTTESERIEVFAPNNLMATQTAENAVQLTWNSAGDGLSYEIQISKMADYSKLLASSKTSKLKMNVKGLTAGTEYYARVRTVCVVSGENYYSDWSNVSVKIALPEIKVGVPENVTVANIDSSKVRISWAGDSTYQYEMIIYSDANYSKKLASIVTSKQTMKVSGLTAGKTYYVSLRSMYDGEYSDWVNVHFTK